MRTAWEWFPSRSSLLLTLAGQATDVFVTSNPKNNKIMFSQNGLRYLGLAAISIVCTVAVHAENFTGDKYIDFNARGQSAYSLSLYASIAPGGNDTANAYASFGSVSASSWGYNGEAGVAIDFYNIRKVGGVWTAETVYAQTLRPDASGHDGVFYYNVALPSAGWASGSATCSTYSNVLYGSIY